MLDDERRRGGSGVWDCNVGLTAGLNTSRAPFDSHSQRSTLSPSQLANSCNGQKQARANMGRDSHCQ